MLSPTKAEITQLATDTVNGWDLYEVWMYAADRLTEWWCSADGSDDLAAHIQDRDHPAAEF